MVYKSYDPKWRVLRELSTLRKEKQKLLRKSERSVFLFFFVCVCRANSYIVRVENREKKLEYENVYYFRAFFYSWISKFFISLCSLINSSSKRIWRCRHKGSSFLSFSYIVKLFISFFFVCLSILLRYSLLNTYVFVANKGIYEISVFFSYGFFFVLFTSLFFYLR